MASVRSIPSLPRRWYPVYAVTLFTVLLGATSLALSLSASAAPTVPAAPAAQGKQLVGSLQLTPGSCKGGKASGTYLRMVLPSGSTNGPFMSNNDSSCSDKSFTLLSPGKDGGLRFGSYQTTPGTRFGADGDAKANRITAPARFYGTSFATSTSKVDPQTKASVPAPTATVSGGTVTADLRAFAVTWNNQDFNQGAPKPDGSTPGNTKKATGTYDAGTGAFTLDWASQVVGGPFDKFTGTWHFSGRFVPAAGTSTGGGRSGSTGSTTGGTGTTSGSTTGGTSTGTTGGTVVPGAAPSAGAPAAGSAVQPGTTTTGSQTATTAPTTTETITKEKWKVSVPVVGLAVGIALLGFGALILLSILGRKAEKATAA